MASRSRLRLVAAAACGVALAHAAAAGATTGTAPAAFPGMSISVGENKCTGAFVLATRSRRALLATAGHCVDAAARPDKTTPTAGERVWTTSHGPVVTDTTGRANQGAQFVRHLENMLVLARVIAQGARNRDESRGAHFKPDFKTRDDANFLRTTLAMYGEGSGGKSEVKFVRALEYPLLGKTMRATDEVDISLVKPRVRKYETAGAASADAAPKPQKAPDGPITTNP